MSTDHGWLYDHARAWTTIAGPIDWDSDDQDAYAGWYVEEFPEGEKEHSKAFEMFLTDTGRDFYTGKLAS